MISDAFDIVVVAFPFTDLVATRRRPALVLTARAFAEATGTHVLAMITTARRSGWPHDVEIANPVAAGLRTRCCVRVKLTTMLAGKLGHRIGTLAAPDRASVQEAFARALGRDPAALAPPPPGA